MPDRLLTLAGGPGNVSNRPGRGVPRMAPVPALDRSFVVAAGPGHGGVPWRPRGELTRPPNSRRVA